MVLYTNICIGQRVEVKMDNTIHRGTVKFKGYLNGVAGEWVGVELNRPVGDHDGMINGRRYFSCPPKHGIFTMAAMIRFVKMRRCLYNPYTTVDPESVVEEELFGPLYEPDSAGAMEAKMGWMDEYRSERINSPRFPRSHSPSFRNYYPHPHPIGAHIAPATMLRPETARAGHSYRSAPIHVEYGEDDWEDFIHSPSIPQTHMPHSALRRQVHRGWETVPWTRNYTVNTARDPIKYGLWNNLE